MFIHTCVLQRDTRIQCDTIKHTLHTYLKIQLFNTKPYSKPSPPSLAYTNKLYCIYMYIHIYYVWILCRSMIHTSNGTPGCILITYIHTYVRNKHSTKPYYSKPPPLQRTSTNSSSSVPSLPLPSGCHKAVVTLQAAARGYLCRKRLRDYLTVQSAASLIQASWYVQIS